MSRSAVVIGLDDREADCSLVGRWLDDLEVACSSVEAGLDDLEAICSLSKWDFDKSKSDITNGAVSLLFFEVGLDKSKSDITNGAVSLLFFEVGLDKSKSDITNGAVSLLFFEVGLLFVEARLERPLIRAVFARRSSGPRRHLSL